MAAYLINKMTKKKDKVPSGNLDEISVKEIMAAPCITVSPETTVEDAGKILVEKSFNTLPVVDAGNTLVGILTAHDVLKVLLHQS